MKRVITFMVALFVVSGAFAQSAKVKREVDSIDGLWQLDINNNVSVTKTIELPGLYKDEIYNRAISYFVYNSSNDQQSIQDQDFQQGFVIAKGVFPNVHFGVNGMLWTYEIQTTHIVRIDVKDQRARLIITLLNYESVVTDGYYGTSYENCVVSKLYPVAPNNNYCSSMGKTMSGKAFCKSYDRMVETFAKIEHTLLEGNTGYETEQW